MRFLLIAFAILMSSVAVADAGDRYIHNPNAGKQIVFRIGTTNIGFVDATGLQFTETPITVNSTQDDKIFLLDNGGGADEYAISTTLAPSLNITNSTAGEVWLSLRTQSIRAHDGGFRFINDSDTGMTNPSNFLQFIVSGNDKFSVGNTINQFKNDGGSVTLRLTPDNTATNDAILQFGPSGNENDGQISYDQSGSDLGFVAGDASVFQVRGDEGNVRVLNAGDAADPEYELSDGTSGMFISGGTVAFSRNSELKFTIGDTTATYQNDGAALFRVYATAGIATLRLRADGGGSNDSIIEFGDGSDVNVGRIFYDHSSDEMDFYVGATQRATISSSGVTSGSTGQGTFIGGRFSNNNGSYRFGSAGSASTCNSICGGFGDCICLGSVHLNTDNPVSCSSTGSVTKRCACFCDSP